jgi:molybdopterin-binding protein
MQLSTRNQLAGKVTGVKLGTIMAEVTVDIGGQEIVARSHAAASRVWASTPART